MDSALQLLWSLRKKTLSIREISQKMQLSEKQVKRKIKKWQLEGWLSYSPGQGRGHLSTIYWLKDVEKVLLKSLDKSFTEKDFLLLSNLNMNYFSESFQEKVVKMIIGHVSTVEQSETPTIKIPIYNKSPNLIPHHINDTESGWISSHIYSRIVWINDKGEFEGDLVHHWDKFENSYYFYLRPRLLWHNGEAVKVAEIIQSLTSTFQLPKYSSFTRKLGCIEKVNARVFCIEYIGDERELLSLLTQIEFSLNHPEKLNIGTGAYKVEKFEEGIIQMAAHTKFHLAQAFIDTIQIFSIPSTLQRKIEWSKEIQAHQLQCHKELSGIVSAYLNPQSDKLENQHKRSYLLNILKIFATQIGQVDTLKVSLIDDCIKLNKMNKFPIIKIGYIVNQIKFASELKNIFLQYDVEVDVTQYTVDQEYSIGTVFEQVDILIMGEFPDEVEVLPLKLFYSEHPLSIISEQPDAETWHCVLYESYREIYYPLRFRRSLTSIYGYPDLARSWICE